MSNCNENLLTIRAMNEADIDVLLSNFAEQVWSKPREVLTKYFDGQRNNALFTFVAELGGDVAGYVVLYPDADFGPFAAQKIPLLSDFIVFKKYQRNGIGGKILDAAEARAAELCERVHLGVGLHSGYGAAQRIYVKRGYVPDGSGVWFNNAPLEQYADCKNDDELVLYLVKDLS